ncbi:hypothetical protein MT3378 [Mycobacterium tuberculosis CDC1551]|uniref:Uncharacterized protein n=1 Tax=Mycobacterium tuberculosis (strain CDC 1551 / Oshkosh) TaxID=83331 RepID=Q8VJ39_MYCTO|nr:hypothetical protein MT3378 [Mycobacterium tuberculosis CDC1551]
MRMAVQNDLLASGQDILRIAHARDLNLLGTPAPRELTQMHHVAR